MNTRQITKHGKTVWQLDWSEGKAPNRRRHRLFGDTKDEVMRKYHTRLAGVDRLVFTHEDRLAKKELGDNGSMLEAVRYFLAHKPTGKRVRLSDAITECCDLKRKRNCREAYLSNLKHVLRQFRVYAGDVNCCDINPQVIERFMESHTWAASTRAGMLNRLSAFFAVCVKRGYCNVNPVDATETPVVEKLVPHIFTVEQAHRLLDTVHVLDPRLLQYYTLGMFCGIRPDELKRLPVSAVKLDQGIVDIPPHVTKTRDRRIVEISENARAWLRVARPSSGETVYFSRRWHRQMVELSRVEWLPDIMRHSFASYHIQQHQSADKTAMELGHQGSTKMLFRHYKATVTREDAAAFWKIEPVIMLTVVASQTGTEG